MKFRKTLAVIMSIILVALCAPLAFAEAADDGKLSFNADGTFKIIMMNDLQDQQNTNKRTIEFINTVLDAEQPDLVVLVGDQLSDAFAVPTKANYEKTLANFLTPMQQRGIPFLFTFGNHDYDRAATVSLEEQEAMYKAYSMCYATEGCDAGTYNVPVYSSDGTSAALNVYMMDTHNRDSEYNCYDGVHSDQIEWYKQTGDALKAANGGEAVPSILFQHIPVKEIYTLLKPADEGEYDNAVYTTDGGKWFTIDETKVSSGVLNEMPCSEIQEKVTGQYEAWLEQGDIIGAYFGHDHVNNFIGVTDEGIKMGYNGGTGFATYGNGGDRSVRLFTFNENDVENYTTRLITYNEALGTNLSFTVADIFSPALLTVLMRIIYKMFGWMINK